MTRSDLFIVSLVTFQDFEKPFSLLNIDQNGILAKIIIY